MAHMTIGNADIHVTMLTAVQPVMIVMAITGITPPLHRLRLAAIAKRRNSSSVNAVFVDAKKHDRIYVYGSAAPRVAIHVDAGKSPLLLHDTNLRIAMIAASRIMIRVPESGILEFATTREKRVKTAYPANDAGPGETNADHNGAGAPNAAQTAPDAPAANGEWAAHLPHTYARPNSGKQYVGLAFYMNGLATVSGLNATDARMRMPVHAGGAKSRMSPLAVLTSAMPPKLDISGYVNVIMDTRFTSAMGLLWIPDDAHWVAL